MTATNAEPTNDWVRRLGRYVLQHRRGLLISLAAAVAGSVGQAAVPLIARQIIDQVIISRRSALWPFAHLLQTARTADRIALLSQGRVIELGTHEELLAARGDYAGMWRSFELLDSGG